MNKIKFLLTLFSCFYFSLAMVADDNKENINTKKNARKADNYFVFSKYMDALPLYENLVKEEPENIEYNYRLGLCYYFSNKNILNSISYFEKAKSNFNANDTIEELYLWLGYAYQTNNEFEKAIDSYNNFKRYILKTKEGIEGLIELENDIERCKRGIEAKSTKPNIIITNLGSTVNSEYPDYAPVLTPDENSLLFTSKRKGSTGNKLDEDKYYFEDVYISTKSNNNWNNSHLLDSINEKKYDSAINQNNINTKSHDASIAISNDGKQLYIYRENDIWISNLNNQKWSKPEKLNQLIDAKKSHEPSVSLTIDKNTLYFVSERKGGFGGKDIYKASKLADGNWGDVTNLGPEINTPYDEDAPFIDAETGELYFSSEGHNSIGGFDIFKTKISNEKWEKPENLGWPINSGADDIFYILNNKKDKAYFTSLRNDGLGNYDIYEITYLDRISIKANIIAKNESTNKNINGVVQFLFNNELIDSIQVDNSKSAELKANKNYQILIPSGVKNSTNNITYTTPQQLNPNNELYQEIIYEDEKDEKGNIIGIRTTSYLAYTNLGEQAKNNFTLKEVAEVEKQSFVDFYENPLLANNSNGIKFKTILFDFEKDDVKNEWYEELNKIANYLSENTATKMNIIGHTDSKGSDIYNYILSLKRANQVKKYLIAKGVQKNRLVSKGEGEKQPIEANENNDGSDNEQGRTQNRRVEFYIQVK